MSTSREIVATLVAGVGTALSATLVQECSRAIERSGGTGVRVSWLAQGVAVDLFSTSISVVDLRALLLSKLADQPIDLFVQPVVHRQKKLLVADMESTIIEQEMLDELAGVIGLRDKVAEITRRAMNGELDFAAALRERVGLLKGLPASVLDDVAKHITLMPGADVLLATMRARGAVCWLVSGGFTYFVDPVAQRLGFQKAHANTLVVKDGVITGAVTDPILDKNSKKAFLQQAASELGIALNETLSVGDGANDVPMLSASNEAGGLGIAYHAKPNVRAVVPHQVNHGDLTALLYAQGYAA